MKNGLLIMAQLWLCVYSAIAQPSTKAEIEAFTASTGARATIDSATQSLAFLRFPYPNALQVTGADAREKSLNFISEHKALFGLRPGTDELQFREQKTDKFYLDHVTLQQTYKGVMVWDGVIRFHYDINKGLTAVNGNYISGIKVDPVPTLAQHEAEARALELLTAQNLVKTGVPLKVIGSALYIFQKGLAQGYNGTKLLVYEVEVRNDADVREFMYIDAHNGQLAEQFSGIHGIERQHYDGYVPTGTLKWKEGQPRASYDGAYESRWAEMDVSTHVYNIMKNAFGYVSYDNKDSPMISVFNTPGFECPRASWNGVSANFCADFSTDDVVAHEWAHAYMENTTGLVTSGQAGAIDEAFADFWGEAVDWNNNGYMDNVEEYPRTNSCNGSLWKIGEYSIYGSFRDMYMPSCEGYPGKLSDPLYVRENGGDAHKNSTVLSHAFALLGNGGVYEGQTIKAVGMTKLVQIAWRAQWAYMTRTTDFAAMADIIEAAASDLVAFNLPTLSIGPNPPTSIYGSITSADLLEIAKAINVVELRGPDPGLPTPLLAGAPALCKGASPEHAIYTEDFESGLGGFTTSFQTSSSSWQSREWAQVAAPAGRSGHAAFAVDYAGGDCDASVQAGIIRMESPAITIPADNLGNLNMVFDHFIATEDAWDGGNIQYSINGGEWTLLPADAFTANGYNSLLNGTAAGSDNPLGGQPAFTGTDDGALSGSWGQSQVDLTSLGLAPGSTIRFRFEMGTDGCGGIDGWYIDDLRIYSCVNAAVHFAVASDYVLESSADQTDGADCRPYTEKTVTVQIDKAPTQPVTVTFNAPGGTAKNGTNGDYTITPMSVTLEAGALSKSANIRVYNDGSIEETETIDLTYSVDAHGGDGHTAADLQNFRLTILDDDLEPGNYIGGEFINAQFNNYYESEGWKVVDGGGNTFTWEKFSIGDGGLEPAGTGFYIVGYGAPQNVPLDEILESPSVNTLGKQKMVLTFSQDWNPRVDEYPETGTVEVWDGSSWHILLTQDQATGRRGDMSTKKPDIRKISIPDEYANSDMKIRFRYQTSRPAWWGIENVKLQVVNTAEPMSAVNTGNTGQQYLGPNETVAFYDRETGNVMAKIKNLSDHDYGCTTVEVDRAGNNASEWLGGYSASNKTFKVTPATNNASGKFEITLYYKASELSTFTPEKILSMCKTASQIEGSSIATAVPVTFSSTALGNGDYAFTATFETGFSAFALSDAPPATPLPVTLVKFQGKHTPEGNLLQWTTGSESNNAYFAVEESTNGRNFTETGRVPGAGNASAPGQYHFTDVDFSRGITYYRLKQVDFDGKYAYSRIVAIDAPSGGSIRFYPNPVQSSLHVELAGLKDPDVGIEVINTSGQTVLAQRKARVQNGKLDIQLGKQPSGVYQVLITHANGTYRLPVFKL